MAMVHDARNAVVMLNGVRQSGLSAMNPLIGGDGLPKKCCESAFRLRSFRRLARRYGDWTCPASKERYD
jgi:hypothetical protein